MSTMQPISTLPQAQAARLPAAPAEVREEDHRADLRA